MRSLIVLLTVFCFGISSVHAEHFDKRFKPGYELLEQGQYDQALETFEQLKTDNPDSELIDYSIASVFYKKALALKDKENTVELNTQDPAAQAEGVNKQQSAVIGEFANAKKQFEAISNSSNDFLRENAPLNAANCSSQIAKIYHPEHQYKERVGALVQALSEYDTYIGQFPDQDSAQRNRDHVNYLLKQLLRNPPEEEEQQEGEDDNSEEDEDQQDQDKEDSGEEEEPGENEDEQEGSESEDSDIEEKDGDSDPQQTSASNENESDSSESKESENGKSPEEQNMEAILESLEAKNQEEQKNLRRSKNAPRVKGGKWW